MTEIPNIEKRVTTMKPVGDESSADMGESSYTAVASQPLQFLGNENIRVKITDFGVGTFRGVV